MPLLLLGLLLMTGLLVFSIIRYLSSGEEDPRSVRERYPKAFRERTGSGEKHPDGNGGSDDDVIHAEGYVDSDSLRGDIDYIFRNLREAAIDKAKEHGIDPSRWGRESSGDTPDDKPDSTGSGNDKSDNNKEEDDSTIIFPTDNVEAEKNKRNIH